MKRVRVRRTVVGTILAAALFVYVPGAYASALPVSRCVSDQVRRGPLPVDFVGDVGFVAVEMRSCKKAERIALAWFNGDCGSERGEPCRVRGFRCRVTWSHVYSSKNYIRDTVRCVRKRESVRLRGFFVF
jgi:hypothetical protein